jgi:hypothetical protein
VKLIGAAHLYRKPRAKVVKECYARTAFVDCRIPRLVAHIRNLLDKEKVHWRQLEEGRWQERSTSAQKSKLKVGEPRGSAGSQIRKDTSLR